MKKVLAISGSISGWLLTLIGIVVVIFKIPDLMSKLFWLTLIAFVLVLIGLITYIVLNLTQR